MTDIAGKADDRGGDHAPLAMTRDETEAVMVVSLLAENGIAASHEPARLSGLEWDAPHEGATSACTVLVPLGDLEEAQRILSSVDQRRMASVMDDPELAAMKHAGNQRRMIFAMIMLVVFVLPIALSALGVFGDLLGG